MKKFLSVKPEFLRGFPVLYHQLPAIRSHKPKGRSIRSIYRGQALPDRLPADIHHKDRRPVWKRAHIGYHIVFRIIARHLIHGRMAPHPGNRLSQPVRHIFFIYDLLPLFRLSPRFVIAVLALFRRLQRTHDLASAFRYNVYRVNQFIGSLPYFNIRCIFPIYRRSLGKVIFEQTVCQALEFRVQPHLHRFRTDHGHTEVQVLHLCLNRSPG